MKKFILAAFLLLLGSGLASAQELFPLQQVTLQPPPPPPGSGCSDPDSGLGASLGLTCQTAYSDDFDGTSMDTSKWFLFSNENPIDGQGHALLSMTWANGASSTLTMFDNSNHFLPPNRPIVIEWRVKYTGWPGNSGGGETVFQNWLWACKGLQNNPNNGCLGNNVPEIDFNETFTQGISGNINLWNGGTPQQCYLFGGCQHNVGPNVVDGNWHYFDLRIDPSPAPNGTIYWYVDNQIVQSGNPPYVYWLHPEQSSTGLGYDIINSMNCQPNACADGTYTEQIDYIHVSY